MVRTKRRFLAFRVVFTTSTIVITIVSRPELLLINKAQYHIASVLEVKVKVKLKLRFLTTSAGIAETSSLLRLIVLAAKSEDYTMVPQHQHLGEVKTPSLKISARHPS